MTKQKFIEKIAGYVEKYAASYGILVHSPIIAQAILESGWGESKLASTYHNYFGIKCGTKWTGKSVNMNTYEEYEVGTLTQIRDNFRVYDSMEDGVKGYFEFIQLTRYQNLKGITDPIKYLETIHADGYATSSQYVENCSDLIEQNKLTEYDRKGDNMAKVSTQQIINDMVDFAVRIANDNSHGYSQAIRSLYNISTPKSFDCSSLALTAIQYAFEKNGITPTPKDVNAAASNLSKGLSYTGNMLNLRQLGFEVVATNQTAHAKMKKGDLELSQWHHVAIAIDGDNIVHARTSEGTSDTRDNSGNEIRKQPWYKYSKGWTHRLRFTGKGLNLETVNDTGNKTVTELAKEVLLGVWGDGTERKAALEAKGYDYEAVQAMVNQLVKGIVKIPTKSVDELAKEVIAGVWGDGKERENALTKEGYDYDAVQDKVNELLRSSRKSIDELAREVINGVWGVNPERKRALTEEGYDYNKVQKRVNELLKG